MKKIMMIAAVIALAIGCICFTACSSCTQPHEHAWGEPTVVRNATCGEEGERTYKCECGETKTEVIPKLEHTYDNVLSYDEGGHYYAAICGHDAKKDYEPHSEDGNLYKNAYWHWRECSVCHAAYEKQAHTDNNGACSVCYGSTRATEGLAFELSADGSGYILAGKGNAAEKSVIIPALHEGLPVIAIADGVFAGVGTVESVSIPDSVRTIGRLAFNGCAALSSVELGGGVEQIGFGAFGDCPELTYNTYGYLKHLGNHIDKYVAIMGMVNSEGARADIHPSVKAIASNAFDGCANLKRVYISDFSAYLSISVSARTASPFVAGASLYLNDEKVSEVAVPAGVSKLGPYAFAGISADKIILPEGITEIGEGAFAFAGVKEITLPSSVSSVGKYAFYSCSGLTSAKLNCAITELPESAFSGCSALTAVELSANIAEIANNAFEGCESLPAITIPASVDKIGSRAFYNCNALGEIKFDGAVKAIGESAFESCTALSAVVLPDGVEKVADYAFRNCINMTALVVPASVTEMGTGVFNACEKLTLYVASEQAPAFAEGWSCGRPYLTASEWTYNQAGYPVAK